MDSAFQHYSERAGTPLGFCKGGGGAALTPNARSAPCRRKHPREREEPRHDAARKGPSPRVTATLSRAREARLGPQERKEAPRPPQEIFAMDPGVSQDGEVIFSVAPDTSGYKLQLSDTSYLKNNKGLVDLGF
jgi:hypothetical protein